MNPRLIFLINVIILQLSDLPRVSSLKNVLQILLFLCLQTQTTIFRLSHSQGYGSVCTRVCACPRARACACMRAGFLHHRLKNKALACFEGKYVFRQKTTRWQCRFKIRVKAKHLTPLCSAAPNDKHVNKQLYIIQITLYKEMRKL